MSVEFIAGNALVSWEQQPQLSNEFLYARVSLLYPLGDAFAGSAASPDPSRPRLVDGVPHTRQDWSEVESPFVWRDISASAGVIFRVCNGFGMDSDEDFECLSQTFDISTSQGVDNRGPIIDLVGVTPTSIDPGDVVTATLRLRDISGISDGSDFDIYFEGCAGGEACGVDRSVSLSEDGAETVAILQATWPAWEFGCGEFGLFLGAADSLGNNEFFTYPIDVSCVPPGMTLPPGATTPSRPEFISMRETAHAEGRISWSAPASDGGVAVSDYIIEYAFQNDDSWTTFEDGISTATSAILTGLEHSTYYSLRISAVNLLGASHPSYTTAIGFTGTPYAPEALQVTCADGDTDDLLLDPVVVGDVEVYTACGPDVAEVALSWRAVEVAVGLGQSLPPEEWTDADYMHDYWVTDFIVEYSSDNGSTWATFDDGISAVRLITVSGLSPSTIYTFRVSAINGAGTSPASNTVSVETLSQ